MSSTLSYTGSLTIIGCGHCHIDMAVPQGFLDKRKQDGKTFWCPAGHKMSYGPGENEQLRRRLDSTRAQLTHERDQRQAAERSAAAHKGQATRLRKRAAAGVCPCCKRTFQDLARHMDGQHPGFGASDG